MGRCAIGGEMAAATDECGGGPDAADSGPNEPYAFVADLLFDRLAALVASEVEGDAWW